MGSARAFGKAIVASAWVGLLAGAASAVFLRALGWATAFRDAHPALLFCLPLAGLVIALVYEGIGKPVAGGNNLLLERIHEPGEAVPLRLAPLILVSTVLTHLFGGSAGREGTAIQLGGALASLVPGKPSAGERRLLILSGISGGFGAVFGTPLAGMVFGLEVPTVGRMRTDALVTCFVSAVVGDLVCRTLGIHHRAYSAGEIPTLTPTLWLGILALGALSGLVSKLFCALTHAVQKLAERVSFVWLRPVVGGLIVIGLTYVVGSRDYLGLSLPLIERSFSPGNTVLWAFALKILFTAVTLGSGFKGGEVTPLFCIGATLGAALAQLTGQPVGVFAALGFVAVFAGAAKTPLACFVMGIELFGAKLGVPLAAVCLLSFALSGNRGIYAAQRRE